VPAGTAAAPVPAASVRLTPEELADKVLWAPTGLPLPPTLSGAPAAAPQPAVVVSEVQQHAQRRAAAAAAEAAAAQAAAAASRLNVKLTTQVDARMHAAVLQLLGAVTGVAGGRDALVPCLRSTPGSLLHAALSLIKQLHSVPAAPAAAPASPADQALSEASAASMRLALDLLARCGVSCSRR